MPTPRKKPAGGEQLVVEPEQFDFSIEKDLLARDMVWSYFERLWPDYMSIKKRADKARNPARVILDASLAGEWNNVETNFDMLLDEWKSIDNMIKAYQDVGTPPTT